MDDRRWGKLGPSIGLLWFAFPIVALATSDPSLGEVLASAAGVAAFAAIYIGRGLRPERRGSVAVEAGWAAAMLAIACALTLFVSTNWAMMFCFAAVPLALRTPAEIGFWAIVAVAALAVGVTLAGGGEDIEAIVWGATTIGTGTLILALGRLVVANLALLQARAELAERAVAEERMRFSRDLHDLLGQSLSVIALKAELGRRRPEQASAQLGEIETVARDALASVREAVSGYRQPTLAGEVAGARMALEAAGIAAEVDVPDAALPPDAEAVLAWAVREGTTNVIRHSGARRARIVVGSGVAEIDDDGRGGNGGDPGHGLAGLRERAERLGGTLVAGPRPEGGFGLRVTVPVGP